MSASTVVVVASCRKRQLKVERDDEGGSFGIAISI